MIRPLAGHPSAGSEQTERQKERHRHRQRQKEIDSDCWFILQMPTEVRAVLAEPSSGFSIPSRVSRKAGSEGEVPVIDLAL